MEICILIGQREHCVFMIRQTAGGYVGFILQRQVQQQQQQAQQRQPVQHQHPVLQVQVLARQLVQLYNYGN